MRSARTLAALLVCFALTLSMTAAAADDAAAARQHGDEAMLAMRYSDALAHYTRAAALAPDQPGLHYSLARAHQFLGEYPEALTELEQFVARASPDDLAKVGRLDRLQMEIRPRVATLSLRCAVRGARVLLRDTIIGTTPLAALRVNAGTATLRVELDGFFTETRDVVLPGGGALDIDVELHPKATNGLLAISTTPRGGSIAVDGRSVGSANPRVELAVSSGPHDIVARHEGFDDVRVPVVLAPGSTRELSIVLEKSVPLTSKWWFWTGVAVVVAGGVATAFALTTERGHSQGTLTATPIGAP